MLIGSEVYSVITCLTTGACVVFTKNGGGFIDRQRKWVGVREEENYFSFSGIESESFEF